MFLLSRWERAVERAVEGCNRDCIIGGYFGAVCELEWVQVVWDDGVDVSHDQPFKAFHGYRYECYWVIVI
jgi:hypothetical protein